MESIIIDNQIVSFTSSNLLTMKFIGLQSIHKLKIKRTWGSRLIDNHVLSLLTTGDVHFNELNAITNSTIAERIANRIIA